MKLIKMIAYVFTKRQKAGIALLLLVIIIGAFLELAGVAIIMPFMDAIIDPNYVEWNKYAAYIYQLFELDSILQFIILVSIALIFIYIFKNIFIIFMGKMQYHYLCNYQRQLAEKMLKCYIRQPYLYHLRHGSTEMIRNVNDDVRSFFNVVINSIQLITEVCVCLVLVIFLLYQDRSITIGICLVLVFFTYAYLFVIKKRVSFMGEETRKYIHNINKGIVNSFAGIKEVKILDRERHFVSNFQANYKDYVNFQIKYFFYGLLPRPLMETVCIVGMLGVIVLKLISGTDPTYFIPTISVFAVASLRMIPSFSRIAVNINNITFSMPAVKAIHRSLKDMEELMTQMEEKTVYEKELTFNDSITISALDFCYPGVGKHVLSKVDLMIPKNKSVAFVGPSGEGKTTLADIVLGLLVAESGAVMVDGIDVRQNITAWHEKLGYIPQAIYLMEDTIKSNIVFGLPEEEIDEERLWKALEDAQMKEFVHELVDGLDTEVGERGIRLSGGQRQRIGIARALYNNPEILVLDEATSALDSDTEKAVMDAIERLAGQKTLIIIAHRLSTIENCDMVYEVSRGMVKCTKS
ncbi:MAG: ABC transporter ATP-binding protein/permease [Lachnospiraceae bacterium]|nr:ABC transporter ATP-binding protein/permease [Lachnospiraceae bacterium]